MEEDFYIIEERVRMGNLIMTIHEDNNPLGSLFFDPIKNVRQIESIRQLVKSWNEERNKEIERERIRSNERKSRGDDSSYQ